MPPRKSATAARAATHPEATEPAAADVQAFKEQKHGYEFFGPPGAFVISFGLPLVCYLFTFLCNDITGCPVPSLTKPSQLFSAPTTAPIGVAGKQHSGWEHALRVLKVETGWPGITGLLSWKAFAGTLAWYGLSLALYVLLPAQEVDGTPLRGGGRLKYRFNSFTSALLTLFACAAGTWVSGPDFQVWTFIQGNYLQILTSNILISYGLAIWVYLHSFSVAASRLGQKGTKQALRELAQGGHSGNMLYDWFIGRELNPRITLPLLNTEVDIKAFMELRPGMLGWLVFDLAFIAKQYASYGYVTDSIIIVTLMQGAYVLDALYNESAILTTIDITTDGFGMMLAFGDLVWVPFTYSLQARYLSVHPVMLGPLTSLAILALGIGGYTVFRLANSQKNAFRTNPEDPSVQHLEYIETRTGSRLLVTGWWGRARHINYLGDWMLSWSYCLPTLLAGYKITPSILYPGTRLVTNDGMKGMAIPITYFYMLYFAVLLVHRAQRDDEKCRRKYGKDWEEYCRRVPSRIIPGIY